MLLTYPRPVTLPHLLRPSVRGTPALLTHLAQDAEDQELDQLATLLHQVVRLWEADKQSGLFRLTYVSHSRPALGDHPAILSIARAHNAAAGITGALMASEHWFGQVLEGGLEAVEITFARILQDMRHSDVRVLRMEPVVAREFGSWAMAEATGAPDALLSHAAMMHQCLGGHSAAGLQTAARDILDMLHHRVGG